MIQSINGSYVCWRCRSRILQPNFLFGCSFSSIAARRTSSFRSSALRASGASPAARRYLASVQDAKPHKLDRDAKAEPKISIRERLRTWEAEHPATVPFYSEAPRSGTAFNVLTRSDSPNTAQLDIEDNAATDDQPWFNDGDSVEIAPSATQFQAGDLIEVGSSFSRVQMLAVCLGRFNNYDHFYTNSGRWFTSSNFHTYFVVSKFAELAEIQPVIDELPDINTPIEVLNSMQLSKEGPSRAAGARVLEKMARFQTASEKVHQLHATELDNAFNLLSKSGRYLTLKQITNVLLNKRTKVDIDFPAHVSYAVHKVLMRNDVCFRAVSTLGHNRRDWLFEISSAYDVSLVNNIQTLVRMFHELPQRIEGPLTLNQLKESQLGRFIIKARDAIDHSRKSRDWTPYGMLGPYGSAHAHTTAWTSVDASILHFMQLWASNNHFSASSGYHWVGAAIMRALERYDDVEYLDTSAGWTFLQEIGWIAPWDLHARHALRLPEVGVKRSGGFNRAPLAKEWTDTELSEQLTKDIFQDMRKDFAGSQAYAIDSDGTEDIDDAISLEPTSNPEEYWIHVHVADPASSLSTKSSMTQRAQLMPTTLYLSGFYESMWGCRDIGQEFSLGTGQRCLTFSGKVNDKGTLLEYKVTPGRMGDVIYMNIDNANEVVGYVEPTLPNSVATEPFTVGKPPTISKQPTRKMTTASELSQENVAELKTLDRLANALQNVRLAKGAFPIFPSKPATYVSMEHTSITEAKDGGQLSCSGDPFIKISVEPSSGAPVVGSTMRMACEIAARWCADRNVPVPFVSQPTAHQNLDLLKPFTEKTYFPMIARGERPGFEVFNTMRSLIGADEVSTTPGPYFIVGADYYTKATSPLRRYSDMIVHWQIESALLQEYESGTDSGATAIVESRLPFSKAELDLEVLPMLRLRERMLRGLSNQDGQNEWMLQALVRAWKFADKEPYNSKLPETFKFTVDDSIGRHTLKGRIDWFDRPAKLMRDSLPALGVAMANVQRGDVFEVKLVDVNVHSRKIEVEAVAKL